LFLRYHKKLQNGHQISEPLPTFLATVHCGSRANPSSAHYYMVVTSSMPHLCIDEQAVLLQRCRAHNGLEYKT